MSPRRPVDPQGLHDRFEAVWGTPRGWRALSGVNHTSIGKRFLVTGFAFFLFGGLLAMLIRAQLAIPNYVLLEPNLYNQVFTMHGTVMMFLFAVPMIDRKSTRLNSSHVKISYAVFCLK